MRVERSYLVRVVQVYEGDPPTEWDSRDDWNWRAFGLESDQDEHVCNHWKLISDVTELLDDDQWEANVVDGGDDG